MPKKTTPFKLKKVISDTYGCHMEITTTMPPKKLSNKYTVHMKFNEKNIDRMIDQLAVTRNKNMKDGLFGDELQERYDSELKMIEDKRKEDLLKYPAYAFIAYRHEYKAKMGGHKIVFGVTNSTAIWLINNFQIIESEKYTMRLEEFVEEKKDAFDEDIYR